MEIKGVVDSVKECVGSDYIFGFRHGYYLCHNVVTGGRIPKTRSSYDIIFIESCQLSIASIHGTGITMEYFDHNNE